MTINEPDVWCFSSASGASLRWEKAEKEKSGNPASWHQTDPTIPGEPQKERAPGCLGYIGDEILPSNIVIFFTILRIPFNQPV